MDTTTPAPAKEATAVGANIRVSVDSSVLIFGGILGFIFIAACLLFLSSKKSG